MLKELYKSYYQAVYDTDKKRAEELIHDALEKGISAQDLVLNILTPSLEEFSEQFVDNKTSLAHHYLSSSITGNLVETLLELFPEQLSSKRTVILGTPVGDFHGLGKKIVGGFLKASLFKVIDLGTNIKSERFIEEASKFDNSIIGISSMMVHTTLGEEGPNGVRRLLKSEGLEKRVKLVVGGAPYKFDPDLWKSTGADGCALDGRTAVQLITSLFEEIEQS